MTARLPVDALPLAFTDQGEGLPVLFQHGLGGSEAQLREVFPDDAPGLRRISLDCRGHGASPPDPAGRYGIRIFAEDCLRLADARGIGRFVAGGISMGAAIALHLAHHHPDRVIGLILARPAWVFDAAPETMRPYAEVARYLEEAGPERGRALFDASPAAGHLAREAPANLATLRGFFAYPNPGDLACLLARIAADGPGVSAADAAALRLPCLVIGHGIDRVHPWAYAQTLAGVIPAAKLVEIPPKATEPAAHQRAFRSALRDFLLAIPA